MRVNLLPPKSDQRLPAQNAAQSSITHRAKSKALQRQARWTVCRFLQRPRLLPSPSPPPHSHPGRRDRLTWPEIQHAQSGQSGRFALAVPSAWHALPPHCHRACSLVPSGPLLNGTFSGCLDTSSNSLNFPPLLPGFIFLQSTACQQTDVELTYFICCLSPQLERKLQEGRDIYLLCSFLHPLPREQCLVQSKHTRHIC